MALMFSTTRGVPFDPAAAGAHRSKQADRLRREQEREERAQAKRLHGRHLDQIEHAYRERARDRRGS